MQNNNTFWLGIGILIAALVAGGFFFMQPHPVLAPTSISTSTPQTSTTTQVKSGNSGNGVVLPAGINAKAQPPSLNGSIKILPSLSADLQAALRTQEETLIAELKASPNRSDLWLKLGLDRKIAGDYAGAIEAWNYVAAASSLNYVAYGNLGDLYMNFQVNYPKAEANYKAAIAANPTVIDYYKDLYTLYSSFYKTNTTAAADIVAQGLKANPNNPDLLQLQAQITAKTK